MPKGYTKTTESCIYQDDSTGHYMVLMYKTSPKTGKRRKIRYPTRADPPLHTIEEAIQARLALREEPEEKQPRPLLADYANEWWERKKPHLKPSTRHAYFTSLKHWIFPSIGDIYLDAFSRRDVIDWVSWAESRSQASGEPYAKATLTSHRRVLWILLKDMAADLDIADPTRRVRPMRSTRQRVRPSETLTSTEIHALCWAALEVCPLRAAEIFELAYTGMRSGELWALHVDQLEEDGAHIRRAVSRGKIVDTTKTGFERHIYRPALLRDISAQHRQWMIRTRHRGLSSGLLYPSETGTPRTTGSLTKALAKASERAGITKHVSPRVLRRSFNTAFEESGVSGEVTRSQLGHASGQMTHYYFEGHLEAKRDAFTTAFGLLG